jgi:predicted unusual protein kinase regulating ubiquinone biosynthesis (AarF/ABC1/UbiB family)
MQVKSNMNTIDRNTKSISLKERRKRIIQLFRFLVFDVAKERTLGKILGKKWLAKGYEARNQRRAQRFVETALLLGGVLIKLGQYLSARFDILPEVWIKELSRLQDAVPPVDFSDLRPIIEADLGGKLEDLFLEFNQSPLASASLGQVHEARLPDGTRVAVKVRRPGIDLIIEADLEALNRVIDFLKRRTDLGKLADLSSIAREFEVTLRRELDYTKEAKNAERFKANLQKLKHIYVPQIYAQWSSSRVLTTEFIDGIKITSSEALEAAGLDRHKTARILANCYLNQLFIDGFFHADPHPGNLFVRPGPHGLQVVFIDFGMVGEISNEMRLQLRRLIVGVVNRDVEGVLQAFVALGFVKKEEDIDKVRVAISFFIEKFIGYDLGQIKAMDRGKVFEEVSYIIYSNPLYIPGDFSFLSRAMETLIGLCTKLSPQLNFITEARPFAIRLVEEELGSPQVVESLTGVTQFLNGLPGAATVSAFLNSPAGEQVKANAMQLVTLPRTLNQTLEKLESGRLQVQFQSAELKQLTERVQRSNERVVTSVMASGFLVSGVILSTASAPVWAAALCLVGAGFMGLMLLRR